jgi:type IV pilus assembly protein PilM
MSLGGFISKVLQEPPPSLAFEISEAGVAAARISKRAETAFQPLKPGVLSVSPLHDNVLAPDELAAAVRKLAPPNGSRKRRDAVLILPDFCCRTAVLDFDTFPSDAKEQLALVKFRLRRSVPFDVETAAVSYYPQPAEGKRYEVVVSVAPVEIIARYEAPFRSLSINPGMVTTSSLAALQLVNETDTTVVAKLSGRILSILVLAGGALRLVRSLELATRTDEEIAADLHPTMVYVEDNLGTRVEKLLLCGFGELTGFAEELEVPVEIVMSPAGPAGETDAGLMGYLARAGALA